MASETDADRRRTMTLERRSGIIKGGGTGWQWVPWIVGGFKACFLEYKIFESAKLVFKSTEKIIDSVKSLGEKVDSIGEGVQSTSTRINSLAVNINQGSIRIREGTNFPKVYIALPELLLKVLFICLKLNVKYWVSILL
jgi:hypothetical protein